jgi:hypothetical protein
LMKANKVMLIAAITIFVFGIFVVLSSYQLEMWSKIPWDIRAVGLGTGFLSISIGFLALYVSNISDRRMKAMAKLEFYEKMAMVQQYIMDMSRTDPDTYTYNKAYADRIFYDLKGAKQLEDWVKDPEIIKMLSDGIQKLMNKVLAEQKHENLIKRLQQIQKGDC